MTKAYLNYRSRITVLTSLILIFWGTLAFRLFQIQVINGNDYRERGKRQAQVKENLPAGRGNIFDRNSVALTSNLIHYSIAVHPSKVNAKNEVTEFMSQLTGKSQDYYSGKLDSDKSFVYLERNMVNPACESLIDKQFTGVVIERKVSRAYPHDNIASQILGFINVDGQGIAGLEKKFDEYLGGKPGWMVKRANGFGKTQREISYPLQQPEDGANIYLTIDLEYQTLLQDELYRRLEETGAKNARGILMNPQDGSIVAMASVPDFEPAAPGKSPTEYQKNRVISDQFEPGSTYKIVCATAALDKNIVSEDQEFHCEDGKYSFGGQIINDWESFGLLNFSQIIEHSSNVGIIKIAEQVGSKNLFRYSRDFGFGANTNINLSGEAAGLLRTTDKWSDISLAELSIGYEVGVTALQLACAYSAVANGGILMKPRIIDQVIASDGTLIHYDRPEVIRKVASQEVMLTLTDMLTKAVAHGTGTKASIPGWSIAGKTGTAQKYVNGRYSKSHYISNFAGFFPADNPQLVGVFVLDEPNIGYHWGSVGAAPIFKRVVERIINLDDDLLLTAKQPAPRKEKIPAPAIEKSAGNEFVSLSTSALNPKPNSDPDAIVIPDIRGMSLRKAIRTIHSAGLSPKFKGSGKVAWQSPRPGTVVSRNSICTIGLK